jgi:arylsulfatase A-like enzyme
MRVVGIAWMPGRIRPGVTSQPASTLDVFPTVLSLAGISPPDDVAIDGRDISALLFEQNSPPAYPFFYYRGDQIYACRRGEWKAHFRTQSGYGQPKPELHDPPLLFHLPRDPAERFNVAAQNPQIIAQIQQAVEAHRAAVVPGKPQLK